MRKNHTNLKKQKGFSILGLILGIVFIGFFGIIGFQIGMAYLDKSAIKSSVKQTLIQAQNNENMREREMNNEIIKLVSLNSINLKKDNIFITKTGKQSYTIEIEHSKEIQISDTIKIVMDLSFAEETK